MATTRLSISGLSKSYSTPVLNDVNLSINCGEIHAIVGENGAGKTTLVNILAGITHKDAGEIILDGERYAPSGPKDGFNAGVSYAAQELSIIDTLSVAENIWLRELPHKMCVIETARLEQKTRGLLDLVGLDYLSSNTPTERLSLSERQLIELAKALAADARVVILDEPTAALAGPQAARLHDIIATRAGKGASIIYISHRLGDVLSVAHTVSVLRDGQVVSSAPANTLTVDDVIHQMSGQSYPKREISPGAAHEKKPVLEVDKVTTKDLPHPISCTFYPGEIVGVAGLAGAGKSEFLSALFGLTRLRTGRISRYSDAGSINIDDPAHAVRSGIGYLGEERLSMGLFNGHSVLANMMIPGIGSCSSLSFLNRVAERISSQDLIEQLAIRCDGPQQLVEQLSGGNQQKTLIARWLHCGSRILLLDEPTRGVDVGTKSAIYELLFNMRDEGKTIIVASSDVEELMTLGDRTIVFSARKLVREFQRDGWAENDMLTAAFQEFTDQSTVRRNTGELPQQNTGRP